VHNFLEQTFIKICMIIMFTSVHAYEKLLTLRAIKSSYEEHEDNAKCYVFSVFFIQSVREGFLPCFSNERTKYVTKTNAGKCIV
jgi:hypothetical protein